MKKKTNESVDQPPPFTPGLSKASVRTHAMELYRDKLLHGGHLTLEDWVLAEKDLVSEMETEGTFARE